MILPFGYELNGVGVALIFITATWMVVGWLVIEVLDLRDSVKNLEARLSKHPR